MNIRQAAETIKRTVDTRRVAERYGLRFDRSGFARCPFHTGDHTASLKVYTGGKGWTCFGCHKGGSVIDMVMLTEGCTFPEAVRKLDQDENLGLLDPPGSTDLMGFASDRQRQLARKRVEMLLRDAYRLLNQLDRIDMLVDEERLSQALSKPKTERTADDWWTIAQLQHELQLRNMELMQNMRKEVYPFD